MSSNAMERASHSASGNRSTVASGRHKLMMAKRCFRRTSASSGGRWSRTRRGAETKVWSLCTRRTGSRSSAVRREPCALSRSVWSNTTIFSAPVMSRSNASDSR